MNTVIYLASSDEVGASSTLHDDFDKAVTTGHIYIDKFVDGKHSKTWKRIGYTKETGSYPEPPAYMGWKYTDKTELW